MRAYLLITGILLLGITLVILVPFGTRVVRTAWRVVREKRNTSRS